MRILVTGGAGFIGSAVCRHLIRDTGHAVVNLDKLTYAANLASLNPVADDPRYSFVRADICDAPAMAEVFRQYAPDAVLHLAAESHVDRSIDGPAAFIETNVVGTSVLVEAARRHFESLDADRRERFRFVHVSTDEVYGSLGPEGLFSETTAYDPSSPYSASKAASDHLARAWHETYGLPVVLSNCSNNYGPYHFPEKLIPLVILNALDGQPLPIYGKGENVRDWLFVEDHARALALVATKGVLGESYNIGGGAERTNLAVVQSICDILDRKRPRRGGARYRDLISFVTDRPGHDRRYAIDASKIERELGWKRQETFESGLERTIDWYLDNDWWWGPIRAERYAGERLGTARGAA